MSCLELNSRIKPFSCITAFVIRLAVVGWVGRMMRKGNVVGSVCRSHQAPQAAAGSAGRASAVLSVGLDTPGSHCWPAPWLPGRGRDSGWKDLRVNKGPGLCVTAVGMLGNGVA